MRNALILLIGLFFAIGANAQGKKSIGLMFGPEGEVEADDITVEGVSQNASPSDLKSKLKGNFGVFGWFEGPQSGNVAFGGRGAFAFSEIKDSKEEMKLIDLGAWSRLVVSPGATELSLFGSAGLSYILTEGKVDGQTAEGDGLGWHVLGGAMAEFDAGTLRMTASVFYQLTSFGEVEYDVSTNQGNFTFGLEDSQITRLFFGVGAIL